MAAESQTETAHVELTGDWSLWREFALRSTGFPVEGLAVFGPGEEERLAEVARDPAFREAVAWQSRASPRRAIDKLAAGAPGSPSQRRWRADVVAGYWQRYCAKNDTIGYFGPLAWGTFAEDGEALTVRSGGLQRERVVHFETWAMEAVAAAAGLDAQLPMGPFPERALRPLLAGTGAAAGDLDRLEAARDAGAAAHGADIGAALERLDASSKRSPGGRPSARRPTAAAAARSSTSTACATSTSPSVRTCSMSCAVRCRRSCTPRAGGAGACSTAGSSCWRASRAAAPGRWRRCSAS